jgi:hypothetical protein
MKVGRRDRPLAILNAITLLYTPRKPLSTNLAIDE